VKDLPTAQSNDCLARRALFLARGRPPRSRVGHGGSVADFVRGPPDAASVLACQRVGKPRVHPGIFQAMRSLYVVD
jgi:hypothetical protein